MSTPTKYTKERDEAADEIVISILDIEPDDVGEFATDTNIACAAMDWSRAYTLKEMEPILEALRYYANHESVIKEAYHSNEKGQITCVHTFINHVAREALELWEKPVYCQNDHILDVREVADK